MNAGQALRVLILFAVAAFTYGALLWVFWHPMINELRNGHSLGGSIKNWYLGDQLTYMSIATNVRDGERAYIEPFTETGWPI